MVSDDLRIAWAQQRLKDMTSMSGLRQDVPQERQSGLTRLARSGARRIQCAAHKPPREKVVTHNAIVRQMEQARQVNSHMVRIFVSLAMKVSIILQTLAGNCQQGGPERPQRPNESKKVRNFVEIWPGNTEQHAQSTTRAADNARSLPKARARTIPRRVGRLPRRVQRVFLLLGFWHSRAMEMRAPPRKYNDFDGFG